MDPSLRCSTKAASKENDAEQFLPEHTISMRKALSYCRTLIAEHSVTTIEGEPKILVSVDDAAVEAATTLPAQREKALLCFWERQDRSPFPRKGTTEQNRAKIATIDVTPGATPTRDPVKFRQTFQNGNIPCRIRGLDNTHHFSSVCAKWRNALPTSKSARTKDVLTELAYATTGVNRNWFLETVGKDSKVPVRFQMSACSTSDATLDDDGRAQECETKEMSLNQWIGLLDKAQILASAPSPAAASSHDGAKSNLLQSYYLKDWHLQCTLRQLIPSTEVFPDATQRNFQGIHAALDADGSTLYEVPAYFQYDLLNAFLRKFTDSGDYMFTYWGPLGSKTTRHSDVMNSFSWSFNVEGTKEWTFYPPSPKMEQSPPQNKMRVEPEALVLLQKAGEAIFVPCGWQHEVRNLEETLSINHNWITTANIDQTWDCICIEMVAIENELESWGMGGDCWEARESMLRGCNGLDTTAYFLMLLTRLIELLVLEVSEIGYTPHEKPVEVPTESLTGHFHWQLNFDLVRLREALLTLMRSPNTMEYQNNPKIAVELIGLEKRLAAVLGSRQDAADAIGMARWAISAIEYPCNDC